MSDEILRSTIQSGIERAKVYGLNGRGSVRFFIELMFWLGIDFDTDPQFPWIVDILGNQAIPDQNTRVNKLYDHVMDYVDVIGGRDYEYVREALIRITFLRCLVRNKALAMKYSPVWQAFIRKNINMSERRLCDH
jgi:hypothetical protein